MIPNIVYVLAYEGYRYTYDRAISSTTSLQLLSSRPMHRKIIILNLLRSQNRKPLNLCNVNEGSRCPSSLNFLNAWTESTYEIVYVFWIGRALLEQTTYAYMWFSHSTHSFIANKARDICLSSHFIPKLSVGTKHAKYQAMPCQEYSKKRRWCIGLGVCLMIASIITFATAFGRREGNVEAAAKLLAVNSTE